MKKAGVIILAAMLVALSIFSAVAADNIYSEEDVYLSPGEWEDKFLVEVSKGDEINLKVESTNPVDVYIIDGDYYNAFDLGLSNLSRADIVERNVTDLDTEWEQPDDSNYYLLIVNRGEREALVDYSYTDPVAQGIDQIGNTLGDACLFYTLIFISIPVALVIIAFVIWRSGKGKKSE